MIVLVKTMKEIALILSQGLQRKYASALLYSQKIVGRNSIDYNIVMRKANNISLTLIAIQLVAHKLKFQTVFLLLILSM